MWSTLKKTIALYCIVLYCIVLLCLVYSSCEVICDDTRLNNPFYRNFCKLACASLFWNAKATEESTRRPTKSLRKPKLTLSNTKLTVSSWALYSAVFVFQNNSAVAKLNERQDRQDYSAVGEQIYKAIKVLGNCLLPIIIETSLPCFLWQSCNLSRNVKQVARDSLYNKWLLPPEKVFFSYLKIRKQDKKKTFKTGSKHSN